MREKVVSGDVYVIYCIDLGFIIEYLNKTIENLSNLFVFCFLKIQ